MPDYRQFNTIDFVQDENFQRWVEGQASAVEEAFWRQWLVENPDKRPIVEQAILTRQALRINEPALPNAVLAFEVQRIMRAVEDDVIVRPLPQKTWRGWWAAAAVVLLVVGAGLWSTLQPSQPLAKSSRVYEESVATANVPLLESRNASAKPMRVTLPDQSTVTLASGTRLSYPARFAADSRTVYLSGDAFFAVTPNAAQPFLVFANETVTKVLGTSFRVNAQPHAKRVTVQVRTGLVAVIPKAKFTRTELGTLRTDNGLLIRPNQQVVYEREAATLRRSLVDQPVLLAKTAEPPTMRFEDAPVVEVLAALERAYGVDIVYDAEKLKNCTLRASLYDEPLFDKLDLIGKTLGLSYQVIDTQVVLTGRGCNQ